ncbi:MAG: hypothetical protein ACXABO_06710 [Promethearchaeota archaeon]|jgi:hypothetical protein
MGKRGKVDIRKRRQKLIKEKKKELQIKEIKVEKKPSKELDLRLEKETKLYWIRSLTGGLSAFIGRIIFGLIGWFMLIWMMFWWLLFPFIVSFLIFKFEYNKEDWNWKNIILPGIGMFFFLFMIVGVVTHTLLSFIPNFSSILEIFI